MFPKKKIDKPWDGYMTPFRLIGNVYFVGTFQASAHLIDTGDGLVLIDTGYENTFYLVIDAIHRLGFDPKDVKYIINTHWHWDHTEGSAALAAMSGAKNIIGRHDAENAKRYFKPDILVEDGDTLTLGSTTFTFLETPGHTRGTISVFFDVNEGENSYRVGMFGGAGTNTLVPEAFDYPDCRADFFASIERLRREHVDVMLGNHTWNNDTLGKYRQMATAAKNPFIDPTLWEKYLDNRRARAEACIKK